MAPYPLRKDNPVGLQPAYRTPSRRCTCQHAKAPHPTNVKLVLNKVTFGFSLATTVPIAPPAALRPIKDWAFVPSAFRLCKCFVESLLWALRYRAHSYKIAESSYQNYASLCSETVMWVRTETQGYAVDIACSKPSLKSLIVCDGLELLLAPLVRSHHGIIEVLQQYFAPVLHRSSRDTLKSRGAQALSRQPRPGRCAAAGPAEAPDAGGD